MIFDEQARCLEVLFENHHAHWHEQSAKAAVDLGIEQNRLNALAPKIETRKIGFDAVIVAHDFGKSAH